MQTISYISRSVIKMPEIESFFCSCLNFMDYALLCAIIISFHHYFAKQSFLRGKQSNSNWNLFILRFEGVYFLYKTCWMEVRFASWENWWILGPLMSLVLFFSLFRPPSCPPISSNCSLQKELFEVSSLMISLLLNEVFPVIQTFKVLD